MVLMVLPSALRPPPQQENQSAQLSPDSPKDQQQSVFAALNQASSGTAGTGTGSGPAQQGEGGAGGGAGGGSGGPGPAPAPDSGYCPEGVGNPKRQIFSVYAPPCASKWAGDNGGATTFGVTATDIKVGVFISNLGSDGTSPGAVDDTTSDSPTRQAYRALEQYLNTRFQFYGRSLRLYLIQSDQFSSSQGQAAADTAKLQYQSFATIDTVVSNYGLTE